MKKRLTLALAGFIVAMQADACSVAHGWRPPTPKSAFDAAQVVIHARVLSQSGGDHSTVAVQPLAVLKGTFSEKTIRTGSSSMCGMQLVDGADYVFFFPKGAGYYASFINQPADLTSSQVLAQLPDALQANVPMEVPAPQRISGRYFQMGFRQTPPTTNDPEPHVSLQIDWTRKIDVRGV